MTDLSQAVAAYLDRERAANRKPQGADHGAILESVADDFGIPLSDLRKAVLDATFSEAN